MEPPIPEAFDPIDREAFENPTLQRLWLFIYLMPIFGLIPSLWNLSQRTSDRRQRAVSRLALTLALTWVLGYGLLNWGAGLSEGFSMPQSGFLIMNSLWSSSYFVVSLWLMVRVWQRRSLRIPGLSRLSKYLP